MHDIGRLTGADEYLTHQIADTFATVSESDRGWTEKVWASLAAKDGSLQVDFGLGKYTNRNVLDGFCGVSRGREQWTVRASRSLASDLESMRVGPIGYDVVEPLKKIRFVLERNDVQPIACDILFEGEMFPFFEERNKFRALQRINTNVIRYHQAGKLSGWVEVNGERREVGDDWFGFRDRSWGMRGDSVGAILTDIAPSQGLSKYSRMMWGPMLMTRPDGSKYEIIPFMWEADNWTYHSSHVNLPDNDQGQQIKAVKMTPKVKFDPKTRFFLGGSIELQMPDGAIRVIETEPLSKTGFHLRTGGYGGWKGHRHGVWVGEYHEDGEYIADTVAVLPELGQFRDCPVRVREGDAVGYGIQESVFHGVFPDLELDAASDYPTNLY